MRKVAIIPVKLNNKRLPGKNTMSFDNGRLICSYIFNTLLKINEIDAIYVFCSSEEIKKYLPKGIVFLKRDNSLDSDGTTMNDVLKSFVTKIDADIYLLTHITAPFLKVESIKKGLAKVVSGDYDSAFSGRAMQEFIWQDNRPLNYNLASIPRTQDLPKLIVETCGFYIFKKDLILTKNRRIGDNPYIVEVDNIEAIDINNKKDFELANLIAKAI